jgi:IclR family acetate operon transcriptional repressor
VGKVFLAPQRSPAAGPLEQFTERTIVDRAVPGAEVERISKHGWAEALGEREEVLNAVTSPVLDRTGKLVAILGVQGPAVRFGPQVMRGAVELLMERAALIFSAL